LCGAIVGARVLTMLLSYKHRPQVGTDRIAALELGADMGLTGR
jgi:hypothetical protein